MSIIYDALKKVERAQNLNPKEIDKVDFLKPKVYLIYTLVVVLGFFVANLFWGFLVKPFTNSPPVPAPVQSEPKKPTFTPLEKVQPVRKQSSLTRFTLNGIFFSAGEGYALINNQIAKVGDTVEGAKVLRISMDEVELESEGSVIKLSCSK